jgi:taurine dioxygenase
MMDGIRIRPLTGSIGARVEGVALGGLDDAQFRRIHEAFLEHCMLVFPGQHLAPADQFAFARRWGEIAVTPMLKYVEGWPGLLQLTNAGKAHTITENWHYDSTFIPAPHALTILAAQKLPSAGGDTMWSNQYLAYETLSPGMKAMLAGVRARFTGTRIARRSGVEGEPPHAFHPVVRTHPETGRKALFVGHPGDTVPHFEHMTEAETRPLLDFLYEHSVQPDRVYRHVWQEGDVVVWDNRCTMHYAVHDYGTQERILNRVTIKGTVPY